MSTEQAGSRDSQSKPVAKAANGIHPAGDDAAEWVRSAYTARKIPSKTAADSTVGPTTTMKSPDGDLMACAGVKLKGEIASCDTLMVEGEVEAQLRSRQLVVAQGGGFV